MKVISITNIRLIRAIVAGGLVFVMTGCGAAAPIPGALRDQGIAPQSANAPESSNSAKGAGNRTSSIDKTVAADVTARMIVRNASLTLIVDDTQTRVDALTKMATESGGFIASSSSTKYDAGLQSKLTLRIPSDKFDAVMDSIRKQAIEVRDESISGQDVTAEYTDLSAQLRNLESAELQLRDIMSKTEKTEDVLSVFNALSQKRGEIEQIKGRIQFISQSAAMATINVTLMPDKLAQPVQIAGWRPEGVAKSAVQALVDALQGIGTLVIYLVILVIPVMLILASPFILVGLIIRNRNRRKKAQQLANPSTGISAPPTSKTQGK